MPYQATVYNVMIASPGDVSEERDAVREVIHRWNAIHSQSLSLVLQPIGWETHSFPKMGTRPQQVINEQFGDDCDLLIGIFWTRLGTPTGKAESGSAEEIERHTKKKRPAMLYFSNKPVIPDSIDMEQFQNLKAYKDLCKSKGLCESFDSPQDFIDKFDRHLGKLINSDPYFQRMDQLDATSAPTTLQVLERRLSDDAKQVLLAGASDKRNGFVMRQDTNMGTTIFAGGKEFGEEQNHRSQARWIAAAEELAEKRLIGPLQKNRSSEITKLGYDIVDLIIENQSSKG